MKIENVRKPLLGGKLSDESFITLFMVGVLIVIFAIAATIVPNFYKAQNIINLVANNWFVIILGIGVTFLLITGNFDMSVGGVVALTGVLAVYFCQGRNVSQNPLANGLGLPYGVAVGLALLCAMGVGGINAFFIARLKVPSIIITLGTMMLARGAAQVITQGLIAPAIRHATTESAAPSAVPRETSAPVPSSQASALADAPVD